jgi:acetyltransferase-like isoleucine patch superfamily enzyme
VITRIAASSMWPIKARAHLYRLGGVPVGAGSGIEAGVTVVGRGLFISPGCYINRNCFFDAKVMIYIGADTHIGPGVTILTSSHAIGPSERRGGELVYSPVHIGRGSWIGANVTILPGAVIGAGCIIAAGSVVTSDTKPDTLYTGVAALPKRHLTAVP